MTTCDQCQGQLYPCDTLSGQTTCVECTRKSIANAIRLRDKGQAIASAAHPDDRAAVDAAIRQAAATGQPFSANSIRSQHGVVGGVVGAAFTAAHKAGLIVPAGDDVSSGASAHGHRIFQWVGVNARTEAA